MATPTTSFLFPDTNIFLQFQFFDSVDWPLLVGTDDVVLVIAQKTVVTELDRIKNDHKSRRKCDLARRVLARIEQLDDSDDRRVRHGVRIEVWGKYPPETDGLALAHPDDRHVAAALDFATQRGVKPTIATDDAGMRFTAKAHGVPILRLPESLRLQPEPNENEAAQRAQRAIQARAPKLKLGFLDPTAPALAVRLRPRGLMSDREIDTAIARDLAGIGGLPWYEAKLRDHYTRLREYHSRDMYTFPVELAIYNDGEAPAEDINLRVSFPETVIVSPEEETMPEKPTPDALLRMSPLDYVPELRLRDDAEWEATSECEMTCRVSQILQSDSFSLPPLFCRKKERDDRAGFEIGAVIRGVKPPLMQNVKLGIRFD